MRGLNGVDSAENSLGLLDAALQDKKIDWVIITEKPEMIVDADI